MIQTHIICTHAQASPHNLSGDDRTRAIKPTVKLLAVNQRMYPCRISRTYQHPSVSRSLSLSLSPSRTPPSLSLSLSISRSSHHSISLSFSHILYYHRIPRNRSHSRSVWLYIQQAPSSRVHPVQRCKSTCHWRWFSCPAGACIDWYVAIGHDIFSNPWCRIHSYNHMSVVCVI